MVGCVAVRMGEKPHLNEEWLREKYKDEGLTQEEIAELSGVTRGAIWSALERSDIEKRSQSEANSGQREHDEQYTDEEWLCTQYHDKKRSLKEMADECGVTGTTISSWMDEFGIGRRDQSAAQRPEGKHTDEEWLREKYLEERMSMRDIGELVGMTPSGIKKWIHKFDIEPRGPAEHHWDEPPSHFYSTKGYEKVSARYHCGTDSVAIHQLVAIAKGADPAKVFSNGRYHVHHRNGVKWDNRPENLELQSSKTHAVNHHHDNKHLPPEEWASESDMEEVLFKLQSLVVDWRESDLSGLGVAADELDGVLREL